MEAAAGNGWNGKAVMTLLLERRGYEIGMTGKMVIAAARNYKEVMALLLEQRGDEIKITSSFKCSTASLISV